MKVYEIYGAFLDLESAKNKIELLCFLEFDKHDSSYYGLYYISGRKYEGESFQVVNNIDLLDNEPLEESDYPVILYINNIISEKNKIIAECNDFSLISIDVI